MSVSWRVVGGENSLIESVDDLRWRLLLQRKIEAHDQSFFTPKYERDIHDPLLLNDLKEATERIWLAIQRGEQIMVYGDYDVDGVASVAVLVSVLASLGAKVVPFLPHRLDHGYGLQQSVMVEVAPAIDLLITVDCGISNVSEIQYLRSQGVDVIVTDHHQLPKQLPEALVVHPAHPNARYPFKYLSGAGVAWKVASALMRDARGRAVISSDQEKWLLDLACLGTIADMVPLVGENRLIVKYGLEVLRRSIRPGVKMLREMCEREGVVDEEAVSFRIAPLLNAAGRMDHPQIALDLLLTNSAAEAKELVARLQKLNRERRSVSQKIQAEAEEQVGKGKDGVVFAYNQDWAVGVIGLVAGRLSEKFARPAVVVGGSGEIAVGSARAPAGTNMVGLLAETKSQLLKFGGHAAAAGFSLEATAVDAFHELLMGAADGVGVGKVVHWIDAEVMESVLNWDCVDMLEQFAPYGEGNQKPVLRIKNLTLYEWRGVGKTSSHAKFTFNVRGDVMGGIGFDLSESVKSRGIVNGDIIDVIGCLEVNEFNGRRSLQLNVKDVDKAKT